MSRIRFFSQDGALTQTVEAAAGTRLLEVAQANGQPLEGSCEGAMACSTCHVLITGGDSAALPPPSDEEEDMLDFAVGASRASRLACQIVLTAQIETLDVRMPPGVVDMSRR
ncbi:ferredoxin [Polymorphobacter multimanifer]|uniref:Ferredoxin n=1 Tax=Polymorphobacter multimanifer TaxID=1070431 RepID=A0A841L8Q1_9SPHN|nr:2Fe-2S iron-sulfur cluster-binding protein [Polymorphobacter multimanifer]MBB6227961.1 ferredoxin [Polymorphobacter multimanifer]GGI93372.1 ferredoxin [Polymorphobacter multimanifer]